MMTHTADPACDTRKPPPPLFRKAPPPLSSVCCLQALRKPPFSVVPFPAVHRPTLAQTHALPPTPPNPHPRMTQGARSLPHPHTQPPPCTDLEGQRSCLPLFLPQVPLPGVCHSPPQAVEQSLPQPGSSLHAAVAALPAPSQVSRRRSLPGTTKHMLELGWLDC